MVTYQLWSQNLTVSLHVCLCWQCTLQKQAPLLPGPLSTRVCLHSTVYVYMSHHHRMFHYYHPLLCRLHQQNLYYSGLFACYMPDCLKWKIKHRLAACQNVKKIISVTKIKRCTCILHLILKNMEELTGLRDGAHVLCHNFDIKNILYRS